MSLRHASTVLQHDRNWHVFRCRGEINIIYCHRRVPPPCIRNDGMIKQDQLVYMRGLVLAHVKKPMSRDQVFILHIELFHVYTLCRKLRMPGADFRVCNMTAAQFGCPACIIQLSWVHKPTFKCRSTAIAFCVRLWGSSS